MPWDCIHKPIPAPGSPPNLGSYPEACRTFSWPAARQELDGLPGGALNIAYEAVDRHVIHGRGELLALRWLAKDGTRRDLTYDDLARLTNRFANVLTSLGIGKGDAVFGLCNRIPALYAAALGTLKNGSVFCPLFSAFGPEPCRLRMELGGARVLCKRR
ncbi:MAG: AMP-binding protein, partial [Planctomycetes bacterium]|nr:AMP-binding protein [Planctomycetota bacterium]